jgi:beta-glucosidase/6-phospho-beta-glucosidase/beta-galactosidase
MMITETSVRDDQEMKLRWLKESSDLILSLHKSGLPIMGYTWFPIIDMVDWGYRISHGPKENFLACFGFWDQKRQENRCAETYRSIIADFKSRYHS